MDLGKRWLSYLLGALLFASLVMVNLFLVLYLSLDYENVEPKILSFIPDSADKTQMAQDMYYKEYGCGFFDCLKKGYDPSFVISKHSQDYWKNWFYISIFVTILLAIAMFYAIDNTSHFLIALGSALIASALTFSTVNIFVIFGKIFNVSVLTEFVIVMFSEVTRVFLVLFIAGILLLILGFGLKFFYYGENLLERIRKGDS